MPRDKHDKRTEEMFKEWPKREQVPQELLFMEWEKIHPSKRPPFWEWVYRKQTGEW